VPELCPTHRLPIGLRGCVTCRTEAAHAALVAELVRLGLRQPGENDTTTDHNPWGNR